MKLYLLTCLCCLTAMSIKAQNKSETTTRVIIEMEENVNGTITKEKRVLEGEEAEKYLKENEVETQAENVEIEIEEEVEGIQSININDDGENRKYKVVTIDGDMKKVLEWDGEGEMPREMKKLMKKYDIDVESNGEERTITITNNDNVDEQQVRQRIKMRTTDGRELEWNGEGEMPEEMQEIMEKEGGSPHSYVFKNEKEFFKKDPNKARLGVMIKEENGVVVVDDVVDDSPALKAGIQAGDHIVKVDDTSIDSFDRLVAEMGTLKPGDKIDVIIKIGGVKEKTIKVQL